MGGRKTEHVILHDPTTTTAMNINRIVKRGNMNPGEIDEISDPCPPWLDFVRDRNLPMTNKINIQNLPNPLNTTIQQPKPTPNPSIIDEDRWVFSFKFLEDLFLCVED